MDLYETVPQQLLKKLASIVTEDIKLEIGINDDGKDRIEELDIAHKAIFCPTLEELVFPELEHGKRVKLIGLVTRGNGNTNSVGFQYKGHILTCYPKEGSIVKYKPAIFVKSQIVGIINREDKYGNIIEQKPKIVFTQLKPVKGRKAKDMQPTLFEDDEK